eukprot:m51a1_g14329 hypothetical protein (429) ;mRNA; r:108696-110070
MQQRYEGCLLGLAAGDALGTATEFLRPSSFAPLTTIVGGGKFALLAGQWTDDTSQALCLAQSLLSRSALDPADALAVLGRWYRCGHLASNGRCFDAGVQTRAALDPRRAARGSADAASATAVSAGNGSLMRLAPVALAYAHDARSAVREAARSSAETTHPGAVCADACRYFAGLLVGALQGATREQLLQPGRLFVPAGLDAGHWDAEPLCPEVRDVALGSYARKSPPEIRNYGSAHGALEAVLWAFSREGALMLANLGEDADTTAAIFGQLAGAYYGVESIPAEWRRIVYWSDFILLLSRELLALSASLAAGAPYEAPARVLALFELCTVLEEGYKAIYDKFSPGPGPPCVWPGGYKTAEQMQEDIERKVREPFLAKAGALREDPAACSLLRGYEAQLADDLEKMRAALERKGSVDGMLSQIRLRSKC